MKYFIQPSEIQLIENKIKSFEEKTGCELLLVVTNASDPYPGASWRFGVFSSFMMTLIFSYYFEFHHAIFWPVTFFITTLLLTSLGNYSFLKRLALSSWEIERETREKATELFHTLGTSKVGHKVTAMICISVLERKIHILVDETLKEKMIQTELDQLIDVMKNHFQDQKMSEGLHKSIEILEEKILTKFQGKASNVNVSELSDTIHFIKV
ncbi:MAG: TPM domain-containing protein [Bacteriovoracaceae bacterium]